MILASDSLWIFGSSPFFDFALCFFASGSLLEFSIGLLASKDVQCAFSFHKSTGRWPCCRLEFFLSSQAWRHSENCRATETILLVSGTLCLFRSRRGRDFLGPPIFSGFSGFDCRCFASGFVHRAHFGIFCFGPISGFLHRAHFCCFGFGLAFGFLHRAHFGIFASGPRWDFCIGLTFGFLASGPSSTV